MERHTKKTPQLLRGMKDVLPEDQPYWDAIRRKVDEVATSFGFGLVQTPLLEETGLFVRSVGKDTDIVEKEMYTFQDRHGDSVSLRPEGTAGVVRAYLEHGMVNRPQPVKLYYQGPFFRYDRPQAGRYRQFHQFGFEVLGEQHPVIDAQLLLLTHRLYTELGVPVSLQVNSVGCPECRETYRKALVDYYRSRKNALCEDCKRRLQKNPLRLLDCKERDCQTLVQDAPQTVDHLCENCNLHFVTVLEHLDEVDVPYVLNPRLVRGLDYYTKTAFEVWPERVEPPIPEADADPLTEADNHKEIEVPAQSALGGGGRYDGLAKELGGQPTPAIGFAGGVERLVLELKKRNVAIGQLPKPDVYVAQLGAEARKKALKIFLELRQAGLRVAEHFSKNGLKAQMEMANKLGAKFAVIVGQKELMDDTVLFRDMENGIQETVDYRKMVPEITKRLQKYGVLETTQPTALPMKPITPPAPPV